MNDKEISFIQVSHPVVYGNVEKDVKIPKPKPSNKYTPEWYIRSENYVDSDRLLINNYSANIGIKGCVPFLEAMHSGYIIELWTDILVEKKDGNIGFSWVSTPDPITERPHGIGSNIPRPEGHSTNNFAWKLPFGIALPKGYSSLISHPFNRFDLPFTTLSGIIDSDEAWLPGNVPFFVKNNFEGIIPAGTPIVQVFPFKRDNWFYDENKNTEQMVKKINQQTFDVNRHARGWYKKNVWKRKKYL